MGLDATGRKLVMDRPAYVEVTGQLFFDDAHVAQTAKDTYRGKRWEGFIIDTS